MASEDESSLRELIMADKDRLKSLSDAPAAMNKVNEAGTNDKDLADVVPSTSAKLTDVDVDNEALHQRKLKILVVDDALSNRKITYRIIQNEPELISSPELCEADDGDVAVEMVKHSMAEGVPFDLVITDYFMNRMHGPEAARKIREELSYRGIIFGLTGNAHDVETFIKAGCNHVMIKPLRRQQLLDCMAAAGLISQV